MAESVVAHKGTGFSPVQYIAKRDQIGWFCGCKKSSSQPACDGTHNNL